MKFVYLSNPKKQKISLYYLKGYAMDLISLAEKITAGSPRTRDIGLIGIWWDEDLNIASTNDFWGREIVLGLRTTVGLIIEA